MRYIDAAQNASEDNSPFFDGGFNFATYGPCGGFFVTYSTTVQQIVDCRSRVEEQAFVRSGEVPER